MADLQVPCPSPVDAYIRLLNNLSKYLPKIIELKLRPSINQR